MIVLVVILLVAVAVVSYLYMQARRGVPDSSHAELIRVRMQAAEAERQLYELTKNAFVAMAEKSKKA